MRVPKPESCTWGFFSNPRAYLYFSTLRHFASISFSVSSLFFTAASTASTSSLIRRGTSSKSLPLQRLQTDAFIARYPFHGKGICKDKPLKAEVIHQQTGNYLTRKRRREPLLRLYGRHLQVPHHHSSQSGTNSFSERIKLYTVQTARVKGSTGNAL